MDALNGFDGQTISLLFSLLMLAALLIAAGRAERRERREREAWRRQIIDRAVRRSYGSRC